MSAHSRRREPSAAEAAVLEGLTAPLSAMGLDLEDVSITKAGRRDLVRVVIDRDGGVDLDVVAEASRLVSDALDTPPLSDHLAGPFVLEVTSPGVDRPLTDERHWRRAVGRLVDVRMDDGETFVGRITSVGDSGIVAIDVSGTHREIDPAHVAKAVMQVEFSDSASDGE